MGKSSKDKRDVYYRLAKEEGYRARSAYKLLHIDEEFGIFNENVNRVIDLCAAPGSWSQVITSKIFSQKEKGKQNKNKVVIAVDLQRMAPIENVVSLQGDITKRETFDEIMRIARRETDSDELFDLVVCDGAPDVTGLHDLDEYIQAELIASALAISTHLLKRNGAFVAKIFRGPQTDFLITKMLELFENVSVAKPKSSRQTSVECFVVCRNYKMSDFHIPFGSVDSVFKNSNAHTKNEILVDFVVCGNLNYPHFDSDTTYPFDISQYTNRAYRKLSPVQPPIAPAYDEAVRKYKKR